MEVTNAEFGEWFAYHTLPFPQVSTWLATFKKETRLAMLDRWAEAMDMAMLSDCKDCTDKMVSGAVDHPGNFELHLLPATILKNLPYRAPRTEDLPFLDYNPLTGEVTRKKSVQLESK